MSCLPDNSPLRGQRVWVTRPREQAKELALGLEGLGAEVVLLPTIAIAPPSDYGSLDQALDRLESYAWVSFTSANAVEAFFARLSERGLTLGPCRLAAVGSRTAERLTALGHPPDLVAEPATSEQLAASLIDHGVSGSRILFPRGDRARETLSAALIRAGAIVEAPIAYCTVPAEGARTLNACLEGIDWIVLTSPSTWIELIQSLGTLPSGVRLAAIGPTTANAIRASGYEVACEANPPGVKGLLKAMAAG